MRRYRITVDHRFIDRSGNKQKLLQTSCFYVINTSYLLINKNTFSPQFLLSLKNGDVDNKNVKAEMLIILMMNYLTIYILYKD